MVLADLSRRSQTPVAAMTSLATNPRIFFLNLIAGIALEVFLFPIGGNLPPKPAGMRTAIEMLDKRSPAVRSFSSHAISAAPLV